MQFDPSTSSVTSEELNQPIRRPNFKKRHPTDSGGAQPLPSRVGVTKGQNPYNTVSREDGFSEGDAGDFAHMTGESLGGIDAHMAQMAMNAETPEEFDFIVDNI